MSERICNECGCHACNGYGYIYSSDIFSRRSSRRCEECQFGRCPQGKAGKFTILPPESDNDQEGYDDDAREPSDYLTDYQWRTR